MWAVIGGSGFEQFDEVELVEELPRENYFGAASSGFRKLRICGKECLFLSRHGKDHELLPSEVNYRANIFALKQAGATKIVSFASVGSLRGEIKPNDLTIPYQYLNQTSRTNEQTTFEGKGVVGHVALGHPIWEKGAAQAAGEARDLGISVHIDKTYTCIEGPTFSTRAESKFFRSIGGDVIGMTGFPEYALAREAGLSYLPCCFCTDSDSWDDTAPHATLEEIVKVMQKNKYNAFELLKRLLKTDLQADPEIEASNISNNLFCSLDHLLPEQRDWLEVISRSYAEVS